MSRAAAGARTLRVACALLLVATACSRQPDEPGEAAPGRIEEPTVPFTAELYFPGGDGLLHRERHELEAPADAAARVRAVVAALLAGAHDDGLAAPWPAGVEVGKIYLAEDGVAYVELTSPGAPDPPPAGSTEELQAIYSVVNSVAFNVSEVRKVALLWNGTQRPTFSGHLDTSRPLPPAPGLIAR